MRNVVRYTSGAEFYIPGSLIRTEVRTDHPLAAGMPEEVAVAFNHGRAFAPIALDGMYEGGASWVLRRPRRHRSAS